MSVELKYAQRIMQRIEQLAQFSAMPDGVSRAYLTDEHRGAHKQLGQWMVEAGLKTWQDEVGNQWGRLISTHPTQGTIIIGSHSDTVVNAGKYDGTLGIILAIEALSSLQSANFPFHVDVVAFADEEGTRFNTTLLGSSAVVGQWHSEWLTIQDDAGITMANAMEAFDLKVAAIQNASRFDEDIQAYLEVHIEQGPVLESLDVPVGIVTGIAGAKRFIIHVSGIAGHAGTVPLPLRHDALCAVAEMIAVTEAYALEKGIVATIGKCSVLDGAVNVIPGLVEFSLDIRSQDQTQLNESSATLLARYQSIAQQRNVNICIENIYDASSVLCDQSLQHKWAESVEQVTMGHCHFLSSGAGHDAMMMARMAPMGMLFIRCDKGISHHPQESTQIKDVAVALQCLTAMLHQF